MSSSPDLRHGTGSFQSDETVVQPAEIMPSSDSSQETLFGLDNLSKTSDITPTTGSTTSEFDKEKEILESDVDGGCQTEGVIADDDPVLKDIPWHVKRVVSLHDDPTLPTITFRYFIMAIVFIAPGAFLQQLSVFRTASAPYSIFFVQIAANYLGQWLANFLPAWEIRIPFTGWSFNLNPGPFSVKEHVLVVIAAASGANYNLAVTPITLAEVFFGYTFHPVIALLFMWSVVWTGYSYAALARQFLIYDPQYPWFEALCQTALFETQKKQRESPSPVSRRQMLVFFCALIGMFLWEFLPQYIFPMLSSMAFLCWVAPNNPVMNFVGSGLGGMGFLNLSFDWANVGTPPMSQVAGNLFLTPFGTQLIVFLAFVVNCWILLPAAKWGKLGSWRHNLMFLDIYKANGTDYPYLSLITPQGTFNETAYAENGPMYWGPQQLWNIFFDYAAFTSALSWMLLFGWPQIKLLWTKFQERRASSIGKTINEQYTDQLNILMRSYQEVPLWWFFALFLCAFLPVLITLSLGQLYIPIWTYFVALATGAVVVVPLGWLYALSNFQLPIGTTNELLYGLMVNTIPGHKNPVGASVYGTIAGDAWYRAQYLLQDQKLGHYMHIPPRAVFFSQLFGSFIGVPINYGCIRWVLNTKRDYLDGTKVDPNHVWTGQNFLWNLSVGTQYVLIGPKRMFSMSLYRPLPWGFLLGALVPALIYTLHRFFPRAKFNKWNTTVFLSSMANFMGYMTTGYVSSLIGGYVVMVWAYRKHYEVWARYNYILAAAFDAGFNFTMLVVFLAFFSGKAINMPVWWGNRSDSSVERCFNLTND